MRHAMTAPPDTRHCGRMKSVIRRPNPGEARKGQGWSTPTTDVPPMFIDRILARFKIQTKVLLFIFPFVVSICAVGITGLYASGLLQGRMEISNSVLQSLNGFKDVYAGMSQFLQHTTEENRDGVYAKLGAQKEVLADTMNGLDPKADKTKLEDAQAKTQDVETRIDGLWQLYVGEVGLREAMGKSLNFLAGEQVKILEEATKMQRAVRQDENSAKTM